MAEQQRKVYDFKSVGQTEEKRAENSNRNSFKQPIGIKTPMRLSQDHSSVFAMHTSLKDQIRDNFRNMIMTNHGERLWTYDYGANLLPLCFELGSDEIDTEAIRRIQATTRKYMPFIDLATFEVLHDPREDDVMAKIIVRISYAIPTLNVRDQVIEAVIYAAS